MEKKEILERMVNLENHILLKDILAGESPSLEEVHELAQLRLQAYSLGYFSPKHTSIH
tara:strand:- start:172 stop:345 length:174 start_codon:yes stop_codon:yes gene_type:complete